MGQAVTAGALEQQPPPHRVLGHAEDELRPD